MHVEALPYEVLGDIFTLACTDGGRTGCSLSLVSKHIRDVSRPSRFHTVALRSRPLSKIDSFLATFALERGRSQGATPLLRHLYIASPATTSYHWFPRYVHLPSQWPHFSPAFVNHALALLALVASELETLVLVQCPRELLNPMGQTGFPRLREVTIVGGREIEEGSSGVAKTEAPSPLYPRLERLNLVSPTILMPHWIKHAPYLTHLRLSANTAHDFLDDDFRQVLLRRTPGAGHSPVFANLELLTTQVYFLMEGPTVSLRNPRSRDFAVRFTKSKLAEVQGDACGGFETEPTKSFRNVDELERTTFDTWIDRVLGGPGCWAVQPRAGDGDFLIK